MIRHLAAVAALCLLSAAVAADDPLEAELIALEKQSWVAWKDHDSAFYQRYLSDDHIEIQPHGVSGKDRVVAGVASPACKVDDYSVGEFRFRRLGPDSALLVYRAQQSTTCFGKPVPSPAIVTSIYQRRDGQWFNILFSQNPLPAEK
ncbi:MAG TPA: nuclear transport factor 2 family protein [Usitatibacter sp.]|nr:nuclear transport factor 2 family protein [Usitatibacter sp.]